MQRVQNKNYGDVGDWQKGAVGLSNLQNDKYNLIMQTPYLIQTANFCLDTTKKGVESLLKFPDMGYFGFQMSTMTDGYKRIRYKMHLYVYFSYKLSTGMQNIVTVYCLEDDKDSVIEAIEKLSKNEVQLKKPIYFSNYATGIKDEYRTCDFWWDIKNHFMFCKYQPEFTAEFKREIRLLR